MKYCISYYKNFRYNADLDEVIIKYPLYKENIIGELDNWREDQRVLLFDCGFDDIPIINYCIQKHPNLAVIVNRGGLFVEKLKEDKIPFFYYHVVASLDEMHSIIENGVSDIYIGGHLAFNLKEVSNYCKSKNVKVRVHPNIVHRPFEWGGEIADEFCFFIRPEDTSFYEPYVDVFEIVAAKEDKFSVLYEVYRNEVWEGDLRFIISGLKDPFYNSGIIPYFGEERVKCKQKCMLGHCGICAQTKDIANKFHDYNLVVDSARKEWRNETRSHQETMQLVEKTTAEPDAQIPQE